MSKAVAWVFVSRESLASALGTHVYVRPPQARNNGQEEWSHNGCKTAAHVTGITALTDSDHPTHTLAIVCAKC